MILTNLVRILNSGNYLKEIARMNVTVVVFK
jgi:hypothetical protein